MHKRYCLLILVSMLMLGAIGTSLPPAKAAIGPNEVRFYAVPTITSAKAVGAMFAVEVWVESETAWDYTPEGIVGYALSCRVDPSALEIVSAQKIPGMAGFLEDFLVRWFLEFEYTTSFLIGPIDKDVGIITDCSEYIMGYSTLGLGAGGGPTKLMRFVFKSRSDVIPSVIDIFGRFVTEISATYTTADGTDHYVDILEDGYYISETESLKKMFFDFPSGFDPADPLYRDLHELWPDYCHWWTLESWIDNGDGVLSVSDQVDMDNIGTGEHLDFHVSWMNPAPVPGDNKKDIVLAVKEIVPEFPLGIGLMMAIAPAIPIVYLWRTRKKEEKQ